jgi:hypothetical protein
VIRKISDEKGGETYEGVNNSNSVVVLLKIFEKRRIFFLDKIENVNNTCLVLCENTINLKQGDIDYVCGVFPLGKNPETLEEYIKNNPFNEKEVIIIFL